MGIYVVVVHCYNYHGADFPLAKEIIRHGAGTAAPAGEDGVWPGADAVNCVNNGVSLARRIPRRRVNFYAPIGSCHRRIIGDGINRARRVKPPRVISCRGHGWERLRHHMYRYGEESRQHEDGLSQFPTQFFCKCASFHFCFLFLYYVTSIIGKRPSWYPLAEAASPA